MSLFYSILIEKPSSRLRSTL